MITWEKEGKLKMEWERYIKKFQWDAGSKPFVNSARDWLILPRYDMRSELFYVIFFVFKGIAVNSSYDIY